MQVNIRVTQILPEASGTSRNGNTWQKFSFIGETFEQYPHKICFTAFKNIDTLRASVVVGADLTVSFDLSSRSFQGKNGTEMWSTDVVVWQTDPMPSDQQQQQQQYQQAVQQQEQRQQQYDQQAAAEWGAPQQQYQQPAYPPQPSDDMPF